MTNITEQENHIAINFAVTVNYSYMASASFCRESVKANLLDSIENERVNGALTPIDISADSVFIEERKQLSHVKTILDVEMSSIFGDYDVPEDVAEFSWIEQNASFAYKNNGVSGIWDFIINVTNEFNDIPEKLIPVINSASAQGHTYILFNQGT